MNNINYKVWTLCMIQDGDRVLMLNRNHDHFQGYIPPGGKLEFPESPVEGAIREVKEETGLDVRNLRFKGIYEYVNEKARDRHIIYNYLTREFSGELITESEEGNPEWIHINELEFVPMQTSIRRRIPYFFKEGTFEIHVVWDEGEKEVHIRET
ncbi:8-oxo-dGTP diphosphatase [Paenibacillus solani]|uniref:8-oxo-dGTP diphosphatase n=1 Tax=Paenibacillus solani TaxID=1705565 RepID=UPI000A744289|nr:8-oxo-dGTP diphosphatase [Paenibacillus solani]